MFEAVFAVQWRASPFLLDADYKTTDDMAHSRQWRATMRVADGKGGGAFFLRVCPDSEIHLPYHALTNPISEMSNPKPLIYNFKWISERGDIM